MTLEEKIFKVYEEYKERDDVDYFATQLFVRVNEDDKEIVVSIINMYEYLPMTFNIMMKLAEIFKEEFGLTSLDNMELNKWSSGGCSTCDYGSKYCHELVITK